MVQLKCPECGKKFSTPTTKCPHCGSQINKEGKVIVISLVKNLFDFPNLYRNPSIEIRQKGFKHVADVKYNEKFELAIDKECELIFKCNFVSLPFSTCEVKPGDVVYLTYDKGLNCLRTIKYKFPVVDKTNKHKVNIKLLLAILGVFILLAVYTTTLQMLESYLLEKHRQAKMQETPTLYENKNLPSMETVNLSQADEYDDLREQLEICARAKQRFLDEVDLIPVKASLPEYQGIMGQTIFRAANKALDEFNEEGEKLERILRQHGFTDEAENHKQDRKNLNNVYYQERRKVEYGK
ncbi:MAG: hypothetical protein PUD97_04470 [Paludibacteraceae bacterium]|nr:hypothetical protein [Paludibacteraceae bacterium]